LLLLCKFSFGGKINGLGIGDVLAFKVQKLNIARQPAYCQYHVGCQAIFQLV